MCWKWLVYSQHHPCSTKFYSYILGTENLQTVFPTSLASRFQFKAPNESICTSFRWQKKMRSHYSREHSNTEVVAFRCQNQLIVVVVIHLQFFYFHILKNQQWFSTGCVRLLILCLNSFLLKYEKYFDFLTQT